jgi:type I restriction enzyme, S subunit
MASEWKECTLGDVIELKRGYDLPQKARLPGNVLLVSSSGVTDSHAESMAKGPGVVTGRYGTLGQVFYIEQDFWPLNTTLYVRDFKGNDPRFISFFLRDIDFFVYSDKAAVPGLNRNHLHQARVRFPTDPKEQRAIAQILGTLDDKIELNRRANETLEGMARALFKAWFVDFEPVRAKMNGRWQRSQSLPGLPAHLYDLFPDRLGESELGAIPEGWKVTSVDDEFDVTMGQSPPGNTYNETGDGLPFYQGRADFEFRFPRRRVYCTAPTRLARHGDTLVSVRAPVGDINMASEDCAVGRGVAAVRHKTGSRSYTYQFMSSLSDVFARFDAEGTVFGSIGKKDFHSIVHVKPPRDLVFAYEKLAGPSDDQIERNERESRAIAQLRDTLLPKLISGELRVQNAERIVGAAI